MKFIYMFVVLSFALSAQAGSSDFFEGCYKTLEINGETILPGPRGYSDLSQIYTVEENEFYYDLENRRPLKTMVMSMFTGYDGRWSSFVNPLVFSDLGEMSAGENELSYTFEGDVFHRNRNYKMEKVDFTTEIRLQKYVGIVTGYMKQVSKALSRQTKVQVILKEVACE